MRRAILVLTLLAVGCVPAPSTSPIPLPAAVVKPPADAGGLRPGPSNPPGTADGKSPSLAGRPQPAPVDAKQQSPKQGDEKFDGQDEFRGKVIVLSGRVKLAGPDAQSFVEGMLGHSVPVHPVAILDWKRGAEAECCFDDEDDRLASLRRGEEVWVKGRFAFAADGLVLLQNCVLLPEEGGVHVHPFDKEKAAAQDEEAERSRQEREKEWEKHQEDDPLRKASEQPLFKPTPK